MDERRMVEFRIGVFVVTTVAVLVILIIMFGPKKMSWFSGDYRINVVFTRAPLIQAGSPVFKNGVEIGRVSSMELIDNDRAVKVVLLIRGDVRIYTDEECMIQSNIMGQASVEFQKISRPPGPSFDDVVEVVPPDSTIIGVESANIVKMATTIESKVSGALTSFTDAINEIKKSFTGVNQIIGTSDEIEKRQKKLETMVDAALTTMGSVNQLSIGLESLVNDPDIQSNLRSMAKNVPKVMDDVQGLMNDARGMINDIRTIMGRMDQTFVKVDSNLDNIDRFTASLGDGGKKFFDSLSFTADRLETTIGELEKFMKALNDPEGSIGQLLEDPEFFNGIRRTAKNIEDITLQVKPILSDARVFSDRLARDPAILGAKGLITRTPPVKGTPSTNIGFIGNNGDFPEPQPEFRLANLTKWWQCKEPRYKYVMPQRMSSRFEADYCEFPPNIHESECFSAREPLIIPESAVIPQPMTQTQVPYQVPVGSPTFGNPTPRSSTVPPRPTQMIPVPAFTEWTQKQMQNQTPNIPLDFSTQKSSPENYRDLVVPLPPVDDSLSEPEYVATVSWNNKNGAPPKLKLDFTPSPR